MARKVGAVPVLLTPLERRHFIDAWNLSPSEHTQYVIAMKAVAAEEGVALIDLWSNSRNLMESAGAVETTKWVYTFGKRKVLMLSQLKGRISNV